MQAYSWRNREWIKFQKNNCCHSIQTILSFRAVISNLTIKYVDRRISNKTIRCGDIIKLDATIRKTVFENADWIEVVVDRVQRPTLVNKCMNKFQVLKTLLQYVAN
jgi:hypothetical protein